VKVNYTEQQGVQLAEDLAGYHAEEMNSMRNDRHKHTHCWQ